MKIISRIIGGLMLLAVIFVPFIEIYGVKTVIIVTIAAILSMGWTMLAIWLLFSNHKIPKW